MNKLDIVRLAQKNLMRRKIRTILTTLGVIIGTTSIVVMLSLGIGLNEFQRKNMERWGSLTMIRVQQGMVFDQEGKPLREGKQLNDDAVAELRSLEGVLAVSPAYDFGGEATLGRKRGHIQLIGIEPGVMPQLEFNPAQGRLLQEGDRNVMVVGSEVINQFRDESFIRRMEKGMMGGYDLRYERQDPGEMMDQRVSMILYGNNRETKKIFGFTVVGILEGERNEHSYQTYVPLEDIKRMRKSISGGNQSPGGVMVVREMSAKAGATVRTASSRRNAPAYNPDDYNYILVRTADVEETRRVSATIKELGYNSWSMVDNLEGIEKTSRTIQAILGGIGGISLLVAALGITNTMIMSIYERTKEIGIMKVIGATFSDIHAMFLTEAGLIGFFGGFLGIGFSFIVSYIVNRLSQGVFGGGMPGEEMASISLIPPWLALFAVLFSILIGLIAGLYPAHRAVRLSPINAIRNE